MNEAHTTVTVRRWTEGTKPICTDQHGGFVLLDKRLSPSVSLPAALLVEQTISYLECKG